FTVTTPATPGTPNAPSGDPDGAYSVSWNSTTGATSYQLQRQTNGGSWSTIHNASGTSKAESGLGTATYGYRVRACSAVGCSGYSTVDATNVAIAPGVSPSISISPQHTTNSTHTVSWGASTGTVAMYRLEQQKDGGGWLEIYTGGATSRVVNNLMTGSYHYRVRACNTQGSYTACSSYRTTTSAGSVATPGVPSGLTSPSTDGNGSFTVSWNASTGANTYNLQQRLGSGAWSTIHSGSATSTAVSGLGNGSYQYQVQACNVSGCSVYSSAVTTDVAIAPGVPSSISASPATSTNGSHTVSWGTASGTLTKYDMDRRINGGSWIHEQDTTSRTKAYTSQGNGSYEYRVRACHTVGSNTQCSGWRTAAAVTVLLPPGTPGSASVPSTDADGSYTVSWTAGSGTTVDYLLQEQINGGSWANVTTTASTSHAITGKGDGNYSYRVRANNSSGSSGWSATDTVAVTHIPGTPGAISGPTQSYGSPITLTWGSALGAVSNYSLEQRKDSGSWSVIDAGSDRTHTTGNLTEGSYDYRVRAVNSSGAGGYTALHSATVIIHTPPPAAPSAHVEPTPIASSAAVVETDSIGTIAGSFRVDESGSATYNIPIATAAGTAGVAPQLSLNYSSQGGNGLAGLGWNIGGLSGISRSRQTLQQDGDPMPITWGPDDRFALDGQRLILVSGTYGAPNSEYRTEIDSFATITAIGGTTGHPDYWEVKRKDGSTSFYGDVPAGAYTDAKQNNSAGQTLTWALKKFQDSVGNPIWFEYHNDSDGHRISQVKYAFGSASGPSGYNARVVFSYGPRNDVTSGYVAGYEFTTGQRLTSVTSYNTSGGETALRTYNLEYLDQGNSGQTQPTTDDLSRLTSIEECVGNNCLPATTFDWSLPIMGIASNATSTTNISPTQSGDDYIGDYRPADINGDGRMDLVWLEASTNNNGNIDRHALYYALANTTGGLGSRIKAYEDFQFAGSAGGPDAYKIEVIDYNADGRMDVLLWDNNDHQPGYNSEWRVHLSTPQGSGGWLLATTGISTGLPANNELTFLDVNSDGLVDAVHDDTVHLMGHDTSQQPTSNRYYRFGSAVTIDYPRDASGQAYWYQPRDHWDPHEIQGSPTDFDGDGRVDFIGRVYGHNWCTETDINDEEIDVECDEISYRHIWLNRGYNSATNTIETEAFTATTVSSTNARDYYDFNGDGAIDILTGTRGVRLGMGDGGQFVTIDNLVVPYPAENASETDFNQRTANNNAQQIQVVDYNRDGYQDIVWFDYEANYLKVRYWNGNGFDAAQNIKYISGSNDDQKKQRFQFMDVNADGITDVVQFDLEYGASNTSNIYLSTQQNVSANRITKVTNGLGAETDISYGTLATSGHYQRINVGTTTHTYDGPCFVYDPYNGSLPSTPGSCGYTYTTANTGDFYSVLNGEWDVNSGAHTLGKDVNDDGVRDPVLELNGPMYVVTNVASSAPAAGANPGAVDNTATSSISYYYGEAKVQAMGRGFLGFQRLRTVDDQTGVITTTSYRQDFPFIGSPLKTEVHGPAVGGLPGPLLSESENIWKLKHWNGSSHVEWNGTSMPSTKLYAPYLAQSIEKTYDLLNNGADQGTHLQTVTTDNVYDGYGNPTTITVTTDDETGSDQFVKTTTNTYGTSTWEREMGRLSRTSVVSTRSGTVSDTDTRTSAFTYITSGSLQGLLSTEVIEPDNSTYRLTTTYLYDPFGNKLRATTSGAGVTSRYSRSEYDSLGRYVERSYNSLEQQTSQVIARNSYGQVTQARDLNGLDVYSAYSPMGRKYFERSDTGGFSKTYLTDNGLGASGDLCPSGTVYKATSESAGGGQSQQCFDQLGRATRSLTQSFNGRWIASDVEFDTLGRTKRQSEPYFLTNNAGAITGSAAYWTTIDYDILGRPTTTTLPDNSTGTVQYNGYSTVTINDLGRRKVETKNALGEVVSVTDNELGSAVETSSVTYAYDAQGNMTTMTDSANNVSTIQYDLLGRKTSMDDPDKGDWTYHYNVYGELTSQTDANGQTSTLTYDVLGRLVHRVDRRANNSVESDTLWTYNNGTSGLGLGLLNNVQQDNDDNGTNDYVKTVTYDSFGRVTHTATALGAGGSDGSYIEQVTYDQFGRTFQTFDAATNPTGATGYQGTQSHYNPYGYMDWVGDAINDSSGQPLTTYRTITAMDARGNVTHETRGDNVNITRVYDPQTGRIDTIDASHHITGAEVQDLEYQWDTIGNLQWRDEKSGNKNLRENFLYDGLNRLTSYQVVGQAAKTVQYDALGNITYKSDVGTYTYGTGNNNGAGDAGVHAVTHITAPHGASYTYDDNGNNLTGDGRTIVYSTFDKPTSISKGNHTTAFEYGPDRARYKRTDTSTQGTKTTLYVGNTEWITQTNGDKEIKRHLGGALITIKLNSNDQLQSTDTNYQYHDHLGSIDVITDDTGAIVQELSFDAWGERRDATDWTALSQSELTTFDSSITTRGFTGHEMLDEVGVIHMNGRIYDAKIARFLQADP
ncbi:SpvB/TcaC N-terminal domain-containing protein, partial [Porticoccus sp. W117]|uniref:SpvB/TcaC N-terminal domain-containing protein n=1 Tax=Porticoccus sp. W117 TaxID=3054777 RepID=UPI00259861F6